MPGEHPPIEPIRTTYKLNFLDDERLNILQESTLNILENTGIQFPTEAALSIFADHGAHVDFASQVVKIPRDLVLKALSTLPRRPTLGARNPEFDLQMQEGVSYFTNDGCGHKVVDFKTGEKRASRKSDVGMMARINDYLSSMGFSWTMVSAQDCGATSPLHEMDITWKNNTKHYQSVTMMGEEICRYGVEMATVLCGSLEEVRRRPPISLIVCTIAPLVQDKEAIEGALVLAEAGIPVVIMSMPTMGTTAPATYAGALVVGDAEVISAAVLVQLAFPGAPVFHSLLHAWADPRNAAYVGYPLDPRVRYAAVEMAHHWGMPALGGAFGTESPELDNWRSAAEVSTDPLLVGLAGAEIVTGIGLRDTYTLLYPEAIILDDDLYHHARYSLLEMDINPETLAVDIIEDVGPGGHFLSQKHTRKHMRTSMVRGVIHQLDSMGQYRDPVEYAREKVAWILENHHPEPLPEEVQKEIDQILKSADKELKRRKVNHTTPASQGFYMPAEWETHEGTWLQWPHDGPFPDEKLRLESIWLQMTDALQGHENLHIIVEDERQAEHIQHLVFYYGWEESSIDIQIIETDDMWVRDNGPIFLVNDSGELAITDWNFNGWGNRYPYEKDKLVPAALAKALSLPLFTAPITLEGGGLEVNGQGTLMATRSSIINANRNPGMSQAEIEAALGEYLGITHFIWLTGASREFSDAVGSDTDLHIDGYARFTNLSTVLYNWTDDESNIFFPVLKRHMDELREARTESGKSLTLVPLPKPENSAYSTLNSSTRPPFEKSPSLAGYANFYIANQIVLVPVYGDINDARAKSIIAEHFPNREIIGLPANVLADMGGMMHCVTQQQPLTIGE